MRKVDQIPNSNPKSVIRHHTDLHLPSENDWLVHGIVPRNGLVVIASAPKTGKTVFANAFARAMCSGGEFADMTWNCKVPVAWCAHEETPEEHGPLLAGLTEEDPFYLSFPPDLPFLDDPDCDDRLDRFGRYTPVRYPYVYEAAQAQGVQLLVVDCLHASVRYSDLANNQVARRIMDKLRRWSANFGIATVVLHHLTKSAHRGYHPERFADSAQILAGASCHFFLESEITEDAARKITLHGAGRLPAPPAKQVFLADSLFDYRYVSGEKLPKPKPIATRITELLEEGWSLTSEEIAKRLDCNPRSVRNVLTTLPDLTRSNKQNKIRYRLEPSPPS